MARSTNFGIPFNIGMAIIVGTVFSVSGDSTALESDIPIIGIGIALILQEAILVQWLSRDANIEFEERLIGHNVSLSQRLKYIFLPFMALISLGLIILYLSERELELMSVLRVISVGVILGLCIDPLLGLSGKGPTAIVGAGLAYILVLQAGINGHERTADYLSEFMPNVAAEWLVIGVLAYLVLSCRWTYYRLFCYEEMEEWKRAAFDTFIPFLIMAIGALPDTIGFLELLFTGI